MYPGQLFNSCLFSCLKIVYSQNAFKCVLRHFYILAMKLHCFYIKIDFRGILERNFAIVEIICILDLKFPNFGAKKKDTQSVKNFMYLIFYQNFRKS